MSESLYPRMKCPTCDYRTLDISQEICPHCSARLEQSVRYELDFRTGPIGKPIIDGTNPKN